MVYAFRHASAGGPDAKQCSAQACVPPPWAQTPWNSCPAVSEFKIGYVPHTPCRAYAYPRYTLASAYVRHCIEIEFISLNGS